jgi:cell division protein FtsI/penicillin-binding protein 2
LLSAAVVVIIVGVTGVGQSDPSATVSVKNFLLAWESGNYAAAGALTSGQPVAVARALRNSYAQLGAADLSLSMGQISVHGNTASAYFHASIDLGRGGRPWTYSGHFTLRRHGTGWLVVWSPSVIVPGLGPGDRLAVLTTVPSRKPLLDSAGQPLILRSPAVEVGVRPDRVTNPIATATKLARVTGLARSEADQMVGQIRAARPNTFLELIQLAPRKFAHLSAALGKVPNLTHKVVTTRLFSSAAPAITGQVGTEATRELVEDGDPYRPGTTVGLSGLEEAYQASLAGTPTTEVVVQNAAGRATVLKSWPGQAGTAVRTTIAGGVQRAAQRALAGLGLSGAVVAVRASTGQMLAVAEHQATGMPAVDPLGGQYQPGQAFTIVPAAALLAKYPALGPNTPIPCWIKPATVGGETYVNVPAVPKLGNPKLSDVFAHACSTAFAQMSLRLDPTDLYGTAEQFGIGAPWRLPLRPSPFVGSIRKPANQAEQAADAIGTGTVLVSPLDMALAAGVVESGAWHQPSVVTGPSGPTLTSRVKLKGLQSQVMSRLQELMAATVSSGVAKAARLAGVPLYGQVGTAPLAGHHGVRTIWFVGFRGDVAFAVVAFSRSPAFDPAVQIARQFAERLPAGS